jgi:hypothetical protein
MRLSLTSFLRPLVWAALALGVIAVGLGRSVPRTPTSRRSVAPRYQGFNGHHFMTEDYLPRFLDRETGQLVRGAFPEGDTLDYAACSPWCDDRGQYQVVGRWMNRSGEGNTGLPREFGLARYTFPEGRAIDRIALDLIPVGEPCWVPGLTPRILFVSGDGNIYRYSFEENGISPVGAEIPERPQPRRLEWRTARPGSGLVYLKDLTWPSDPRLGGKLIASLSYLVRLNGKATFVGPQLWWLQLSDDQTVIESAGRLTVPDSRDPDPGRELEERLPNLAPTPEGGLALAYLVRARHQALWELRVAPVGSDLGTGTPLVRCESSRTVARHCIPTTPAFSTDGRWVYGVLQPGPGIAQVQAQRFSMVGALSMATPGRSGSVAGERPQPTRARHSPRLGRADFAEFVASRLVEGRARHHAGR